LRLEQVRRDEVLIQQSMNYVFDNSFAGGRMWRLLCMTLVYWSGIRPDEKCARRKVPYTRFIFCDLPERRPSALRMEERPEAVCTP
jgi:hypothetical protein